MFQKFVFFIGFFFVFAVGGNSHSNEKKPAYLPVTGDVSQRSGGESDTSPIPAKACEKDEDCALVNPDCCPCTTGGESVAIHKDLVKSYNGKVRKQCNISVQPICSAVYLCNKVQAKCKDSKCVTVKCPEEQWKLCDKQAKEGDHNILTIEF